MDEFYVVTYDGLLNSYKKIGYENGVPKWNMDSMMDCNRYEEWKINETAPHESGWFSTFTYEYAKTIDRFFEKEDFESAKILSKQLYDKHVAPTSKYKVARYFDDVFECYVTGELTKKEANEKKNLLNKEDRCYVSYGIVKC